MGQKVPKPVSYTHLGAGVETVEIFLNTFSELELSYTERLRSVLQDAGMRAAADSLARLC